MVDSISIAAQDRAQDTLGVTIALAHARSITAYEYPRLLEAGDEVIVTYEATKADGHRFRNTEVLTFEGDRIARAEVYFGWNLP